MNAPPNKPLKTDGRTSCPPEPSCLSPVVKYHGLARLHLMRLGFLMRPLLNGGTLGGRPMTDDELVAELVSRGVTSTVKTLFANQDPGNLSGFALGTDDDVCAVHAFACPRDWLLQEQVANPDFRYVFTDWIDLDGSAFAELNACLQRLAARDYGDTPASVYDGSPLWGRARDSRFAAIAGGLLHCRQRGVFVPETFLVVGSTDPSPHIEALEESFLPQLNEPHAVRDWRQWRLDGALSYLREIQARPGPLSYAEQDSIEQLQVEVQRFRVLLKS